MASTRTLARGLTALALVAVGACGDSTGPNTVNSIDAQTATAKVAPVVAVFDEPAFASLEGAGAYFGTVNTALSTITDFATASTTSRPWSLRRMRDARSASSRVALAVLPVDVRGKTWKYDATQDAYVVDSTAAALGQDRFRILLYAWDPLTGTPALPLNAIGYADLIDESVGTTDKLHVVIKRTQGDLTVTDYVISNAETSTSRNASIAGFASNGATRVEFNYSEAATGTVDAEKGTVTFGVTVPSQGFSTSLQGSYDDVAGTEAFVISLGYNGHTLTFDIHSTTSGTTGQTTETGQVKYDGKLYANYSATYDASGNELTSSFTKANGQALTAGELEELQNVFGGAFAVSFLWLVLLWPIGLFG